MGVSGRSFYDCILMNFYNTDVQDEYCLKIEKQYIKQTPSDICL